MGEQIVREISVNGDGMLKALIHHIQPAQEFEWNQRLRDVQTFSSAAQFYVVTDTPPVGDIIGACHLTKDSLTMAVFDLESEGEALFYSRVSLADLGVDNVLSYGMCLHAHENSRSNFETMD